MQGMIKIKLTPEQKRIAIILSVTFVTILVFFIDAKIKNNQIEKLKNEVYDLKVAQDTMSQSNKIWIETTKEVIKLMDSMYNLSQQSNESNIIEKWDSIRNSLITNPDTTEMSEWLRKFADKTK
jgi:signal transduction histidine kinase